MQKKRNIIPLVETYNEVDTEKYIKSYMFIKGFAVAKNLKQTLIALAVARHFHNGQYRKDGMPYIVHPLKVCSTLSVETEYVLISTTCGAASCKVINKSLSFGLNSIYSIRLSETFTKPFKCVKGEPIQILPFSLPVTHIFFEWENTE